MESLDSVRRRDAYCGDEDLSLVADGHFNKLVELAVRVVVICFAGRAANLREGEVYAEWEGLVCQVRLQLVDDLSHVCQLEAVDVPRKIVPLVAVPVYILVHRSSRCHLRLILLLPEDRLRCEPCLLA